jgi:hypothetical protein
MEIRFSFKSATVSEVKQRATTAKLPTVTNRNTAAQNGSKLYYVLFTVLVATAGTFR